MLTICASEDGYKNKIDKGDVKDISFDTDLLVLFQVSHFKIKCNFFQIKKMHWVEWELQTF